MAAAAIHRVLALARTARVVRARGAAVRPLCADAYARAAADPYGAMADKYVATARALDAALVEGGFRFAFIGAVALNANGFRRATDNLNVLINREDVAKVVHAIKARDWEPYYRGTRHRFHDVVRDVPVDFWFSGDFPGDGLPKPVAFPRVAWLTDGTIPRDATVAEEVGGLHVLGLVDMVQLKLASGRLRDTADVLDLIKANKLPRDFVDELHYSVRDAFLKLWDALQSERGLGPPS